MKKLDNEIIVEIIMRKKPALLGSSKKNLDTVIHIEISQITSDSGSFFKIFGCPHRHPKCQKNIITSSHMRGFDEPEDLGGAGLTSNDIKIPPVEPSPSQLSDRVY
jgi:hypothetical protein